MPLRHHYASNMGIIFSLLFSASCVAVQPFNQSKSQKGLDPLELSPTGTAPVSSQNSSAEFGWASEWKKIYDKHKGETCVPQGRIFKEGDMALELGDTMVIDRKFPEIASGILKIEMYVRPDYVTATLNDPKGSVLKVYATPGDKDVWAFRWHYPWAWPEVGGNTVPRFYVADGSGSKRKGLEFTDFQMESKKWYKVAAVLNFETKRWEFYVDDVKLDYKKRFGREMGWWQNATTIGRARITNAGHTMNWVDSLKIYHNGKLISSCGFDSNEGYKSGVSLFDQKAP